MTYLRALPSQQASEPFNNKIYKYKGNLMMEEFIEL
jgi:hypothetical protein